MYLDSGNGITRDLTKHPTKTQPAKYPQCVPLHMCSTH